MLLDLKVKSFDLEYDDINHDTCSAKGYRRWLETMFFTHLKALQWLSPTCTSWVWICRATTGRTNGNWAGRTQHPFVSIGNQQAVRVTIQLIIGHFIGIDFILEQPLSSIFDQVPFVWRVLYHTHAKFDMTWLGGYGASTAKPLRLIHTTPWGSSLYRKPGKKTHRLFTKIGRKVYGKKAELRSSQAFPPSFGKAVARQLRMFAS